MFLSLSVFTCPHLPLPVSLLQKCLRLDPELPVWTSKQKVLVTLTQSLSDVLNYGLFQPAFNGRAGKFLDEERLLREYPLPPITPIPYLEVTLRLICRLQADTGVTSAVLIIIVQRASVPHHKRNHTWTGVTPGQDETPLTSWKGHDWYSLI